MKNIVLIISITTLFAAGLGYVVYSRIAKHMDERPEFYLPSGMPVSIIGEPELGDGISSENMAAIEAEALDTWENVTGKKCDPSDWSVEIREVVNPGHPTINGETIPSKKIIRLRAKPFGDFRHELGHICIFETLPHLMATRESTTVRVHHCFTCRVGYEGCDPGYPEEACTPYGL
jgi:hypothetical protein